MNNAAETDSSKRLTVRLTKIGEPDRVIEFRAGRDAARVIGRAPSSDVVLGDAGVLPVHCYFEREQNDIWLSTAHEEAVIRVNYQPVVGRAKVGRRCILEVGEARLQVVVLEEDEGSPSHGPFGTEVIDLRAPGVPPDLFDTTPVDAHIALGDFPTKAWQKLDWDDSFATTTAWQRSAVGETSATAADAYALGAATLVSEHSSPAFAALVDTVRISRSVVGTQSETAEETSTIELNLRNAPAASSNVEPVQPVQPLPCILIEGRSRLSQTPAIEPVGRKSGPDDETIAGRRLGAQRTLPASAEPPHAEASLPYNVQTSEPQKFPVDPGSFTTMAQPIADLLITEPVRKRRPAARWVARLASLRHRFAIGLGKEPKVIAMMAICAALSLTALAAQTVRSWRYFVGPSVVAIKLTHVAGPAPRAQSRPDGGAAPMTDSPALASSVPTPAGEEVPGSAGDSLVDEAVNHLLLGREAEAAGAYAALAGRYPKEPVYAATAKILRRRLNPVCQQGNETQCGKALP